MLLILPYVLLIRNWIFNWLWLWLADELSHSYWVLLNRRSTTDDSWVKSWWLRKWKVAGESGERRAWRLITIRLCPHYQTEFEWNARNATECCRNNNQTNHPLISLLLWNKFTKWTSTLQLLTGIALIGRKYAVQGNSANICFPKIHISTWKCRSVGA